MYNFDNLYTGRRRPSFTRPFDPVRYVGTRGFKFQKRVRRLLLIAQVKPAARRRTRNETVYSCRRAHACNESI